MNIGYIIVLAGFVSLIMRIFPVLVLRGVNFNRYNIGEILDIASSCIIGQIIYTVAFKNKELLSLVNNISWIDCLNLVCIFLSFTICYVSRSVMKGIFISLIIYIFLILV
ncbi:MAG: AzlD domain-containing protein [Neisseriaceae bacterium]